MRLSLRQLAAPTVVATLGLTGVALAQQHGAPPSSSSPPPAGQPSLPPTGQAPTRPAGERSTSFSAQVDRLTRGPRGEVDGLLLDDGRRVKAPRHAIMRDLGALAGRTVRVAGFEKPAKVGHATLVVDGKTITAPPHERPDVPDGERRVERSGTVTAVTRGPRGEADGIELDDGTRIGVPHHEADASSLIGKQARVSGWLKPAEIKHATVTSGGVTYIRDAGPGAGGPPHGPAGRPPAPHAGGPPAPLAGGPPAPPHGGPRHR